MHSDIIRVEPLSTYLDVWKAPTSVVVRHGDIIFDSGLPPFAPLTGGVVEDASIERQTEIILEQLKLCLEAAGASLASALKCTVYCTSVEAFPLVNAVYARYFPEPPARTFVNVPEWPGRLDVEIDCVAARAGIERPSASVGGRAASTMARIPGEEIALNRIGSSTDPKRAAALQFARRVIDASGKVSDRELERVRAAGFSDKQIIEIVAPAVQFLFTNFMNNLAQSDFDFPAVNAAVTA